MIKRLFDLLAAAVGLLVLSPVFLVIAILIRMESPGPVLFRHKRIGFGFKPFWILKFRTMVPDAASKGSITWGGTKDPRITPVGHVLRRTKLDELPQLINVLKGEMSIVGSRPEVQEYVELFREDYGEILKAKPGMTDFASLQFHDEAALLAQAAKPEEAYVKEILPEKIRLSRSYVESSSFWVDLGIVFRTLLSIVGPRRKA